MIKGLQDSEVLVCSVQWTITLGCFSTCISAPFKGRAYTCDRFYSLSAAPSWLLYHLCSWNRMWDTAQWPPIFWTADMLWCGWYASSLYPPHQENISVWTVEATRVCRTSCYEMTEHNTTGSLTLTSGYCQVLFFFPLDVTLQVKTLPTLLLSHTVNYQKGWAWPAW